MKKNSRILITCGATREPLDPVRFLSNHSTGTFAIEIARVFKRRGHRITLVCAESMNVTGKGFRVIRFETTRNLLKILKTEIKRQDVLIMAAAVSDFTPQSMSGKKIKRAKNPISIKLTPNPDILNSLSRNKKDKIYIGFSVESEEVVKRATRKLKEKNLDLIVAQQASFKNSPFGNKAINSFFIPKNGKVLSFRRTEKKELAKRLFSVLSDINKS